ncbi:MULTISPECIES: tetratricopeptide repeat protein [Bacillus]|uniref:tetratricopeptide repeat protein n=1 Tax=Bacillus TaxID=1386 RepID=UPI00148213F2|nr:MULTISPECIES: aspartate phosphatase [Bacillus]
MSAHVVTKEQLKHSLDDWYRSMLHKQVLKATNLKREVDEQINIFKTKESTELQDSNLLLYYYLLDFRYKLLTNSTCISLDELETLNKKSIDNGLSYYYHFYKGIHNTMLANYMEASEHFGKAEQLLMHVPDEIEKAEFNYKLGVLYYHIHQPLLTIKHALKAKELYEKRSSYELNQLECDVTLGLASITLNQFEQAEEYFIKSLESAKKQNHENLVMLIRYNLGFLYAKQNLSETAIRYLTDVYNNEKPYHKTLFLLAQEHYKINQIEKAKTFLEEGIKIADTEYIHHFRIIQALYDVEYKQNLESVIIAGISYFETQQLYGFIEEYAGYLAKRFYNEENFEKASKYFNTAYEARQTLKQRSALK